MEVSSQLYEELKTSYYTFHALYTKTKVS